MAQSFTQVPVLNFDLIKSAETRIEFLKELRRALVVVGFFYVRNIEPWLPRDVRLRFVQNAKAVCNMPAEEKQKMAMINSKHFLGYSQMGGERTARKVDYRDMFDVCSGGIRSIAETMCKSVRQLTRGSSSSYRLSQLLQRATQCI